MTPHPRRFHPPGRTQRPNRRCPSLPRDGGRHIPSLPVSASLPGSLRIPAKPLRDSAGTGIPLPAPQSPHRKTATGKSPFHAATLAANLARLRCAPAFSSIRGIRLPGTPISFALLVPASSAKRAALPALLRGTRLPDRMKHNDMGILSFPMKRTTIPFASDAARARLYAGREECSHTKETFMSDNYVLLRHSYTGKEMKGYYGFSWDSFRTLGFIWFKRGVPLEGMECTVPPIATLIAFGLFFGVPTFSELLDGTELPIGDLTISGHAFIASLGLVGLLLQDTLIAFFCNRRYTRRLLDEGYEILPGIHEKEARNALNLPGSSDDR